MVFGFLKKPKKQDEKKDEGFDHIFQLTSESKSLYLLDLKALLRLPGAAQRIPLTNALFILISRNDVRFKIQDTVLPRLIAELASVSKRIHEGSPLWEIMRKNEALLANPGPDPFEGGETIRTVPGRDVEMEKSQVSQIQQMIASKAPPVKPATTSPAAAAVREDLLNTGRMSVLDQQAFLMKSLAGLNVNSVASADLSDSDLDGYFEFLIGNREFDKVMEHAGALLQERKAAWIWIRFLSALEGKQSQDLPVFQNQFVEWARSNRPEIMPDMLKTGPVSLRFGAETEALNRAIAAELSRE